MSRVSITYPGEKSLQEGHGWRSKHGYPLYCSLGRGSTLQCCVTHATGEFRVVVLFVDKYSSKKLKADRIDTHCGKYKIGRRCFV